MITILTPTYNRAELLKRAYESLARQTSKNFEWIIVDDGSTDNTTQIVNEFDKDIFKIVYLKQNNGGKHRALNNGIKYATGYLTLILDSDDVLTDDAVAFLNEHIEEIRSKTFAGISGLRGWMNEQGAIGGRKESDSYIDAKNTERVKYHLNGDKAEAYKTSLLKKYPFPEFEGENFLRENAVWDKIALDGYKIRWFDRIIYKCEYLSDGLTKNCNDDVYVKNFQGFLYCMNLSLRWSKFPYRQFKINTVYEVGKKKGLSEKEICKSINITYPKLLVANIVSRMWIIVKKITRRK